MKMIRIVSILMLLVFMNSTIADSELTPGKWRGTVAMHNKSAKLAQFKIFKTKKKYHITMYYNERRYPFDELKIGDKQLNFKLDTGLIYDCRLKFSAVKNAQKYTGSCLYEKDNDSRAIVITMTRPEVLPDSEDGTENNEGEDQEQNNTTEIQSSQEHKKRKKIDLK